MANSSSVTDNDCLVPFKCLLRTHRVAVSQCFAHVSLRFVGKEKSREGAMHGKMLDGSENSLVHTTF